MQLTYCGNVHPAGDLDSWLRIAADFTPPLRDAQQAAGHDLGLGTWWRASLARQLAEDPAARARVAGFLEREGLQIWTLNVFPQDTFHGTAVKAEVYQPDWASEERLLYTRHAAEAAARLAEPGQRIPMSTLPLGYGDGDLRVMARNLVRAVSHIAAMEDEHGVQLQLCLEPEPFCMLETVAATVAFLEEWVFRPGGWTVSEARLRRHLGVCVDLCHLAVVGEDLAGALAALDGAGICLPKVQVSSCLELRDPAALDRLLAFAEPVYLHQTCALSGEPRALDLDEVAARRAEFAAAGTLRTHFHLPVFWDEAGPLGSTRALLERDLAVLKPRLHGDDAPLLEVETYTWGVLPDPPPDDAALRDGIARELASIRALLA